MTKKTLDSMLDALHKGNLFDWLSDNAYGLTKDEVIHVAKELAYAMEQPLSQEETRSKYQMREEFAQNMADFYDTWGFDEEE